MKNTFKALFGVGAALAASCAISYNAQALPYINGSLTMGGGVTLDNDNLTLATTASFPGAANAVVTGVTGTYFDLGVPVSFVTPTTVDWKDFQFRPAVNSSVPVLPLWTFSAVGRTFSFDLTSIQSVGNNTDSQGSYLTISGTGVAHITGYNDASGSLTFTVTKTAGNSTLNFGFASSDTAVPDGGMTMALLGFGMVAVEGFRRKVSK